MSLFGIILCFYLSYIGYLLVPAVGPRFTLDHLQTVSLQAGPFIKAIQEGPGQAGTQQDRCVSQRTYGCSTHVALIIHGS